MNWKRAFVVTAGVGLPLIALLSYGMTRDPRDIPSPLPGRQAPTFTRAVFAPGNDSILSQTVGDSVRLAALRGRVVVVNFWASWCLACRDEHEALSIMARRYAEQGVKFYGLLYNDQERNGVEWIAQMEGRRTRRFPIRARGRLSTTASTVCRRRSWWISAATSPASSPARSARSCSVRCSIR